MYFLLMSLHLKAMFDVYFFLLQMGCCFCDVTSESDSIQGWLSSNLGSHPCVGYVQSYQWKGNLDQRIHTHTLFCLMFGQYLHQCLKIILNPSYDCPFIVHLSTGTPIINMQEYNIQYSPLCHVQLRTKQSLYFICLSRGIERLRHTWF